MDPFLTLQNNMQRDNITRDFAEVIRLVLAGNNNATVERLQELENRTNGIAPPVQAIQNFEFRVPENTLEEIFTRPNYTRPKIMVHYRIENGKNYFNNNPACLAYDDPDRVAHLARAEAALNAANDNNALQTAYNNAKIAQINANRAAEAAAPIWVLCQRSESNDTRAEDMIIRYIDDAHKTIDWHSTIQSLHTLGQSLGYTLEHYNNAMNRFVSFFKPSLSSLIAGMNANETARFLQSLNTPIPDKQKHFKAIKAMVRPVGTELRAIMSELYIRAGGYYADEPQEQRPTLINNLMVQGLQNFTAGKTNAMLKATMQQQLLENQPLNWRRMLETAILSEESSNLPTATLHFMQPNQPAVFNALPLYNTMINQVDRLIQPIAPLVTPLVHVDPRLHQQFYDAQQPTQLYNPYMDIPFVRPAAVPPPIPPPAAAPIPILPPMPPRQALPPQNAPRPNAPQPDPQEIQIDNNPPVFDLDQLGANALDPEQQQALQLLNMQEQTPPQDERRQPQRRYDLRDTPRRNLDQVFHNNVMPTRTRSQSPKTALINKQDIMLRQIAEVNEKINKLQLNSTLLQQPSRAPSVQRALPAPYNNSQSRPRTPPPYQNYQQNGPRPNSPSQYPQRPNSPYQQNRQPYRGNTPNRDQRYPNYQQPRPQTPPRTNQQYPQTRRSYEYRAASPGYRPSNSNSYNRQPYQNYRSQSPVQRPPSPGYGNRYDSRSRSPAPQNYQQNSSSSSNQQYSQQVNRPRSPSPYRQPTGQNTPRPNNKPENTILLGVNCHPNYNKSQGLLCTKCNSFGKHEEYACPHYFHWSSRPCQTCKSGFHNRSECLSARSPTPQRSTPPPYQNRSLKN